MSIIATEKKSWEIQDAFIIKGREFKNLLKKISDETSGIFKSEEFHHVQFWAAEGETAVGFNGTLGEAINLLEDYPDIAIKVESLPPVKISSEKIKIALTKEKQRTIAQLKIEVESPDIEITKKLMALISKELEKTIKS